MLELYGWTNSQHWSFHGKVIKITICVTNTTHQVLVLCYLYRNQNAINTTITESFLSHRLSLMLPASLLYFQQLGWRHWLLEYPCWSHLIPQFLIDLKECKMYKYSEKHTHLFFTISWEKVELVPISHSHKLMSSQPGTKDCPAEIGCVKMKWGS